VDRRRNPGARHYAGNRQVRFLENSFYSYAVGRRFWPDVREHARSLAGVAALLLGVVALELARPWPIKWIVDGALDPVGLPQRPASFFIWTGALAVLVIVVARSLLEYFGTLRLTAVGHAVTRSLRLRIFSHLSELSPAFHAQHKSGDLLVRLMGDVPMLRTMLVDSTVHVSTRVVQIVATVAFMIVMDPLLALTALGLVPVIVFTVRALSRSLTIAVRKQRRKEGDLADFLHESMAGTTVIQSLGGSRHTVRRFARSNRTSARAGLKTAKAAARLSVSVELLLGVSLAVTLGLGAWRVSEGLLSTGGLLVFLSYVRALSKPVRSSAKHAAKVAKGSACGERILAILDADQVMRQSAGTKLALGGARELRFRDVHHSYDDGTSALEGVSLELRPGESTALFGPSGAGKSTITSLALRLFDPTSGTIELDGSDVREFDLDSLRAIFGLAMQSSILFGESVRENLLLARPEASDEQLIDALERAAAAEFVFEHPDGLDAQLGAGGVGVSGGQAKRISIARALLRDAPILIADEPFQGLDGAAADHVAQTLREYSRKRIVLVITHDASRLTSFDRVLHLQSGSVIGDGTHAELTRSDPLYRTACTVEVLQ